MLKYLGSLLTSAFATSIMVVLVDKGFSYFLNRNISFREENNQVKIHNIIDGYHNFMALLPEIFNHIGFIYNTLSQYKSIILDKDMYNFHRKNVGDPDVDYLNHLTKNLYSLDSIIKKTDKFSADLLFFDRKSFNAYTDFCTYILNGENAKNINYQEISKEKLIIFLKIFSKNFSLKKDYDFHNLNWFTDMLRYNTVILDKSLVENNEITR
ncbi:hypothetical protein JMUB3935_1291 [Leptotrichia trevisanii]|jgi:hypothetical protein|uniref:Uncharacterized protein n=1 Tax=Leptotrichia trevisanii TaxID=109328 RepID=A0A510K1T8_9FUSO|nr:hypothetical protein [Leptotrichia trevisanii]BBM45177.1 hypothetical protein JMUB3870_1295 [Leptotrichia trevisanii]BBM52313.1 hypothetical protein JMUB3935_1291 [Leptotrichia trevisanii]